MAFAFNGGAILKPKKITNYLGWKTPGTVLIVLRITERLKTVSQHETQQRHLRHETGSRLNEAGMSGMICQER